MHKYILSEDQYYEAILQIRPRNEEVLEYVMKQIEKDKKVHIAKIFELKEGIDLYLSDRKFTQSLGRKLKKVFKGEMRLSRKLYSYDRAKGKRIYRVTVLFRLE